MKKTIQKPENWQDFETLCKQLWGEVWGIPMKIKKNGRNGQPQAGVDIYGVPKGELNYWGIQCKGKDDYTSAKLTTKEIDDEIAKASKFNPNLDVFIFATTMNKDSAIEEYIRIKDIESRKNELFEILLYCWEDIADLIDDNQDTYNYWVGNRQHKTRFEFELHLKGFTNQYTIRPKCIRTIRRYRLRKPHVDEISIGVSAMLANYERLHTQGIINPSFFAINQGGVNKAMCGFEVIMKNTGTSVIEDWRVQLKVVGEHEKILDQLGRGPMGMIDINALQNKRTYVKENIISYRPKDNEPLIQKDKKYFEVFIIPYCKEYVIPIEWNILARDYSSTGIVYLKVEPNYDDRIEYVDVETADQIKQDEIISIRAK